MVSCHGAVLVVWCHAMVLYKLSVPGRSTNWIIVGQGPTVLSVGAGGGCLKPGRVTQSVGHLTRKSEVMGSIPGLATYFLFSFR